jgi:hypothetical protein
VISTRINAGLDTNRFLKVTVRDLLLPETAFPALGVKPKVMEEQIAEEKMMAEACSIEGGAEIKVTRAFPLISCAAVIYILPDKCYLLHHAGSGALTNANIETAFKMLAKKLSKQPAKEEVFCVYAHPGKDRQYTEDADMLIEYGLPAAQVFEVYNVGMPRFGINNLGGLGY